MQIEDPQRQSLPCVSDVLSDTPDGEDAGAAAVALLDGNELKFIVTPNGSIRGPLNSPGVEPAL